jgi:hypothetical protein
VAILTSTMVEVVIAPPSSSSNPRNTPRQRDKSEASKKKPIWLFACYALFVLACLNLVRTYKDQKESVRLRIEKEESEGVDVEIGYSAGAEENVVTAGVGSSQYGMSVKATQSGNGKKKKKNNKLSTTFNGIRPEPSDGSNDYNIMNPSPSDFKGFSFYVMADTPVRQ